MKEIELSVTCTYTVDITCTVPDDVYDELYLANYDRGAICNLPIAEYWLYENIHLKDANNIEYLINNIEDV